MIESKRFCDSLVHIDIIGFFRRRKKKLHERERERERERELLLRACSCASPRECLNPKLNEK